MGGDGNLKTYNLVANGRIMYNIRPFISGHNDVDFSPRHVSGLAWAFHETFRPNNDKEVLH